MLSVVIMFHVRNYLMDLYEIWYSMSALNVVRIMPLLLRIGQIHV
jgi:hypothetical protein